MKIHLSLITIFLVVLVTTGRRVSRRSIKNEATAINAGNSNYQIEKEPDLKPVNLRYPSAVLFCGTCGGTIISHEWVLTAAHCTIFMRGDMILAGTNNKGDGSGVVRRVKRLVVHPLFTVGPYWVNATAFNIKQIAARWDFMLAELETPLSLDGTVMAAAELDDSTSHRPWEPVGYAGYGTDAYGGYMRKQMHATDMEIRPDKECSTMPQYDAQDMLCSRGRAPRRDTSCNGDSGSGLITNGKLLGVLSWAEDDATVCRRGNKIVFARVAAVRDWIRTVTKI